MTGRPPGGIERGPIVDDVYFAAWKPRSGRRRSCPELAVRPARLEDLPEVTRIILARDGGDADLPGQHAAELHVVVEAQGADVDVGEVGAAGGGHVEAEVGEAGAEAVAAGTGPSSEEATSSAAAAAMAAAWW